MGSEATGSGVGSRVFQARRGPYVPAFELRRVALDFDLDALGCPDVKDPCAVHDGLEWHLFGTAGWPNYRFEVLHATAERLVGPWHIRPPLDVSPLRGTCVAAPGAVADGGRLHLFLQTDYNTFGGTIEHVFSDDGGATVSRRGTALSSQPGTDEAGIYDPHPCEIQGEKYLVYSAFAVVGQPDLHLAHSASGTWDGPWERLGPVLRHEHVWCHNQRGCAGYEWGLEGGQLVELPDGRVLLNVVSFLPDAPVGARQRVVFAIGRSILGPWDVLGPVVGPEGGQAEGEIGHASVAIVDQVLALVFQERSFASPRWHMGLALAPLSELG